MARLGAKVTGIDPTAKNIGIARLHAEQSGLAIDYRIETAEDLAAAGESFDVVLNMEVVEHVADLGAFIADCCRLLTDQGVMFVVHPEPDAEVIPVRHRRRRVCAALAAPRHPRMAQVRAAVGTGGGGAGGPTPRSAA